VFRTAWFGIVLLVTTIWYASKAVIAGLLGVPNHADGVYDHITRNWSRWLLWGAGIQTRAIGWEKVPADVPVVFASNHQSLFDIWMLAALIPTHVRFVSKKELSRVFLLGKAMTAAGHIFLDRQNRQKAFDAYDEAAEAIRRGTSAVVFPEGTRSRTGELQPFKKGPFVLAIAAQVPIVPTYCAGTFTLLPKGRALITPHPVAAFFGEPIPTKGMTYDDRERLMQTAEAAVKRLRDEAKRVIA
jgi:1-acyl-sn-glycerol-3-phosphate acyltransferase